MTPEMKQAIELAAKRAADNAVKRTLLAIGIDVSTPQGVQEQQQDSAFTRSIRLAAASKSAKYWAGILALGLSVISAVVTVTIQHLFGGHP